MRINTWSLEPQLLSAKGVLGRMAEALTNDPLAPDAAQPKAPYKTMAFSLAGTNKILESAVPTDVLSERDGAVMLEKLEQEGFETLSDEVHIDTDIYMCVYIYMYIYIYIYIYIREKRALRRGDA